MLDSRENHATSGCKPLGAVVVVLGRESSLGQQAPVGYDDTPRQPNGKWRVHDGKRPQPRIVAPGDGVAASR